MSSIHPLSSCQFFFFFNDTATTEIYTLSLHDALPIYSDLFPLVGDTVHFRGCRVHGVRRTALAFDDAQEHSGDDKGVENLHKRRRRVSRNAEIMGPMPRVLQHLVLPGRVGVWVVGEPDDEVRKRFLVKGEIAALGLLVDVFGIVDQIGQELLGPLLILGKVPDHRAIGDVWYCHYGVRPLEWRRDHDLLGNFGVLFFRGAQETDGIDSARGLARQHGLDVARGAPGELLRSPRALKQVLDVLKGDKGASVPDDYPPRLVKDTAREPVQEGLQGDVALQGGCKRQATGNAQLFAKPFPAAAKAIVMDRAQGTVYLTPIVLKEEQRGGDPGVGKGEVFLSLHIDA